MWWTAIAGFAVLALGVIAGFALSDWIHVKIFKGIREENSKLWSENWQLRYKIGVLESGINERV